MFVVLLIGLVFIGLSFGLFARLVFRPRLRAAEALRQIDAYGFAAAPVTSEPGHRPRRWLQDGGIKRALDALAATLGNLVGYRFGTPSEDELEHRLYAAGYYTLPPRRFVGYQALLTVLVTVLWFRLSLAAGRSTGVVIVGAILAVAAGWALPLIYLKRRVRIRRERIDYEMPELIDMLVATVEAGIGFGAALQIASRRMHGPLGDEIRLALQEQSMGLSLRQALNNMLARQDTQAVRSFVRSLVQGEQLGVAIGQTLRNLAHEMRSLRRQLAEEKAQQAPVKMIFPLILFIFPALLTVILGPAVLRIHEIFK